MARRDQGEVLVTGGLLVGEDSDLIPAHPQGDVLRRTEGRFTDRPESEGLDGDDGPPGRINSLDTHPLRTPTQPGMQNPRPRPMNRDTRERERKTPLTPTR
ncbi:hypothetical protein ACFWR6_36265, partial [Streptomyces griseus]|uniref:hypothetical protein n=3 Tax=Streptomyces griseus TaxID=1911 RepID=UPI003668F5A9